MLGSLAWHEMGDFLMSARLSYVMSLLDNPSLYPLPMNCIVFFLSFLKNIDSAIGSNFKKEPVVP